MKRSANIKKEFFIIDFSLNFIVNFYVLTFPNVFFMTRSPHLNQMGEDQALS